jgi:hypothetical protein
MHKSILPNPCRLICLAIMLFFMRPVLLAQNASKPTDESFTVEGYYKVKWGYADEFISLYKKNHYPLLKKLLQKGDLLSLKAEKPRLHSSEESRWDYKIILVFKNVQLAYDNNLTDPYKKTLFPDQASYEKEEQRRFEILLAHWDVTVQQVDLEH